MAAPPGYGREKQGLNQKAGLSKNCNVRTELPDMKQRIKDGRGRYDFRLRQSFFHSVLFMIGDGDMANLPPRAVPGYNFDKWKDIICSSLKIVLH